MRLIPTFLIVMNLGWYNTYLALITPVLVIYILAQQWFVQSILVSGIGGR